MDITIKINTDNVAFSGGDFETVRILRELADKIESNGVEFVNLRDINGNKVGFVEFEGDDSDMKDEKEEELRDDDDDQCPDCLHQFSDCTCEDFK